MNEQSVPSGIDPKLLEILVCPGLAFPIRDGIPIMLVDEARRLDDAASTTRPEGAAQ